MIRLISVFVCATLASGCGKKDGPKPEPSASPGPAEPTSKPEADPSTSDHGSETPLGRATLAGFDFEVAALGGIRAGSDAAVALNVLKSPDGRDWQTLNVYVWVEESSGKKLSAPEKARVENGRLHAHASVPANTEGIPAKVVIRLRDGDTDERTSVALTDGGKGSEASGTPPKHEHEKTPHDGVLARVTAPDDKSPAGWLELKLHDDKGDLELWLTEDKSGAKPLDLPTNAAISVTFIDHDKRQVSLAPRNLVKNEDEDGQPNLRDGKTHYFIFPGTTGKDAKWLMGKTFQSVVVVSIEAAGRKLRSDEFVLKPHTHHAGAEHK